MYRFFNVATGLLVHALLRIETLMREAGMERLEQEQQRADFI